MGDGFESRHLLLAPPTQGGDVPAAGGVELSAAKASGDLGPQAGSDTLAKVMPPDRAAEPEAADETREAPAAGCLAGMARVGGYCIDKYEAYVVEFGADGSERYHSPYTPVSGQRIRAKAAAGVIPQAYVSQTQAAAACAHAGKRLCTGAEFVRACRGDDPSNHYPYGGARRIPGYCNEGKGSTVERFFGPDPSTWTYSNFNDPRLNQWRGGLAPTGSFPHCVSPYGIHDCVGNLHEWGSDGPDAKGHARFRGGFYGDAEVNGQGALYVTTAHEASYHDYSTGFRCCMTAAE